MPLLLNRASLVWLVLVAATAFSWWMGSSAGAGADHRYVATALIIVACIKCRLVIRHFMEVQHAGRILKAITDVWALAVAGAILALYWNAS